MLYQKSFWRLFRHFDKSLPPINVFPPIFTSFFAVVASNYSIDIHFLQRDIWKACVQQETVYNVLTLVKTFFKQNFLNKIYFLPHWRMVPNLCVLIQRNLTEMILNDKCRCQWSLIKLLLLLIQQHIVVCSLEQMTKRKRFIDGHLRRNLVLRFVCVCDIAIVFVVMPLQKINLILKFLALHGTKCWVQKVCLYKT